MKLKSIRKLNEGNNVYEIILTQDINGVITEILAHRVNMDDCDFSYTQSLANGESGSITFKLLSVPFSDMIKITKIKRLNTSDAIDQMKKGKQLKSLSSNRVIGYGKCWCEEFAVLKGCFMKDINSTIEYLDAKLCSVGFYEISDSVFRVWGVSHYSHTILTTEEILGEWIEV